MDDERRRELLEIQGRAREGADALEARAAEVLELTKRIEDLTGRTPGWYLGMRARVEAGETLRQVRVLVRTLGDMDRIMPTGAGEGGEDIPHVSSS